MTGSNWWTARIANAVRCVPPQNKPTPAEIKHLPPVSHRADREHAQPARASLRWARSRMTASAMRWARRKPHIRSATAMRTRSAKLTLIASYHCSRYNTNTGVLTEAMFDAVVKQAKISAMPAI